MISYSRIRLEIEGIVQGVGFRPFVFRLACRHGVSGWVRNNSGGVVLEGESSVANLSAFVQAIELEAPPLASITSVRKSALPPRGERGFLILSSETGENRIQIAPDGDVCGDCLAELFDPADRRFRYPFINCTNCGPRFSIITGVPYDRPLTTMSSFAMCGECRAEYENPHDRRFHAQPVACSACGPRVRLLAADPSGMDPVADAVRRLREGQIVAIKGIGGYHLAADPANEEAVRELRRRKGRDEKPFALMVPDLAAVELLAQCDPLEQRLLSGAERPIVLLRKRPDPPVSALVSPANGYFGMMLPSSPLHHLLLRDNFTALIMTSGNASDEPIIFRDDEAQARLASIADCFLVNDRDIHNHSDDSVIRVFQGNPLFLRRSRGYVPRAVPLPAPQKSILALGGELKNTVCLTKGDRAFLSQHIGDLKNHATHSILEQTVARLLHAHDTEPDAVAHDLHPDYLSTGFADHLSRLRKIPVQHHHAHMAACMAENRLEGEVIGVIFDGAGFGLDGHSWGGEFLLGTYRSFQRRGHFRYVPMPGGDAAAREPYRMAIAYLYELYRDSLFDRPGALLPDISPWQRNLFLKMLEQRINAPLTSSCGRLFDAVAALTGVRSINSYEGQAAMELEGLAERGEPSWKYPYVISTKPTGLVVDFRLTIGAILHDLELAEPTPAIARRFHDTVAAAAADACVKIAEESGVQRVVLSGGVFQNKMLTEGLHRLLVSHGFEVFCHRLVPPNDAGLALGQAVVAARSIG